MSLRLYDDLYGYFVLLCEHEVSLVVRRNCYYRTSAIFHQNEIGYVYWKLFTCDGMYDTPSYEHTLFFAILRRPVNLLFEDDLVDELLDVFLILGPFNKLQNIRMFRCVHHVSDSVKCVRSGSKDGKCLFCALYLEIYPRPLGSSNPVLLHLFDIIRPVYFLQTFQKPVCILRDSQEQPEMVFEEDGRGTQQEKTYRTTPSVSDQDSCRPGR